MSHASSPRFRPSDHLSKRALVDALRRLLRLCGAVGVLVVAGCGERPATTGDGDGSDDGASPRTGGTVVVASPSDLGPANSLVARDAFTQEINRYMLFMPLLRYGPDLEYRPYLAESWETLADTGAVFHLRDDVAWHDGRRTTAHDVAFTYERLKDPATGFPSAGHFERWTGVQVVDSFTVRFSFEPHADPLSGLPVTPIMPRHLLDSIPAAEMRQAAFNYRPVGNGPFRSVSREANDRWIFEANTEFPEELGGRPRVDRVVWRVIPETGSQAAAVRTGEVDLLLGVRAGRFDDLRGARGVRGIVRPTRRYAFIGWNGRREPFGDARVRRGLTMALDRTEILEALRGGYGDLAVGPVPPTHRLYDSSLEPLPHAPDSARALLAASGFRNRDADDALEGGGGEELEFALSVPAQSDFNRDVAQMIQSDLSEVGVRMGVSPVDYAALIQRISSTDRNFDAVLMAWESGYSLDLRGLFHSDEIDGPFQLASYRNPDVDRILDRLEGVRDREGTERLWHRLQAVLREEQPWTFLYYFPDLFVARERVNDVEMDIRGALVTIDRWWLEEGDTG